VSYCRWSSDDFKCDLYCYASSQGYTTHVANSRHIGDAPHLDWATLTSKDSAEFHKQYTEQMEWLSTAQREPIGLPYDGESFDDPDLESFLATVTMLRDAGYHVPPHVFDAIWEEMLDEAKEAE
jgi:hypothetical protein